MSLYVVSLLMIGSSALSLFLSVYAWKHRQNAAASPLSLLMAGTAVWAFSYGMECFLTTPDLMHISVSASYLGIASIPVFWLLFAARYSGFDQWLKPSVYPLLFLIPCVTLFMVSTNNLHGLYYSSVEHRVYNRCSFMSLQMGPFWKIHVVYSYLIFLSGLALMIRFFFKTAETDRLRIGLFLAGALLPYAVNAAYVAGFRPFGFLDLTPVAFVLTGIILSAGIFSVNLFSVLPLSLNTLFYTLPDAVFVAGTDGEIVRANPPAQALEKTGFFKNQTVGKPHDSAGPVFSMPDDGDVLLGGKVYHKTTVPVFRTLKKASGFLVVMRDITDRKKTEQNLLQAVRELERWQAVLTGRENRLLELKCEVNRLLEQSGKPPKYTNT